MRLPLLGPLAGCEPDLIDGVEIETPCTVSWDSMYGDDQVRHCGQCRQNVYNVAELSRAEALRLITARERVCLRLYRRPDGTVVTADCWSRLRAARRRGVWAFFAMLLVIGWAELAAILVGIAGLRHFTRLEALDPPLPTQLTPKAEQGPPPDVLWRQRPVMMGKMKSISGGGIKAR